ncbi:MAG: hypothetical protein IT324_31120, partial [Anaerolineae bacterium]|nr:hypothetical protein [Anaerolineae bacterium]
SDRLRRPAERVANQLADSVLRRLPTAPPADLIAIHVMIQRLLKLKRGLWVQTALDISKPLSPLTHLLEPFDPLAKADPNAWIGMEALLSNPGLDGVQARCAQTSVNWIMPGWDWHQAEVPIRHARFLRAGQLMTRMAATVEQPGYGAVRALHLAAWLLYVYKLIGRALDVYQRVVLPPPLNPDQPGLTPAFRMLRLFLPDTVEDVQAYYAELFTAIRSALALVVEASRLTETPVYIPEGLPQAPPITTYPDTPDNRAAATRLIDAWQAIATLYGPTLSNLYQFANASRADLTEGIFAPAPVVPSSEAKPGFDFTPIGLY